MDEAWLAGAAWRGVSRSGTASTGMVSYDTAVAVRRGAEWIGPARCGRVGSGAADETCSGMPRHDGTWRGGHGMVRMG